MFLFFISSTTTVGVSLTQGSERQGFCKKKKIRSKTHTERRWISRCCMVYHGRFVHNQNLFYWDFNGRLGDATSLDFVIIKNLIPFSELILISLFLRQPVTTRTEEMLPKTLFLRNFFFLNHLDLGISLLLFKKNFLFFLFSALFSWDDMSFFRFQLIWGIPIFCSSPDSLNHVISHAKS